MNHKIKKLTRKNKKQKGGYVGGFTNPYLLAAAGLIGGLYLYGNLFQNANTEATSSEESKQSGGKRRTRRRKFRSKKTRKSKYNK